MKITESQLRRIVRSIIKEQYSKKLGHGPDAFEKSHDDVSDPWSAEGDLEYVDTPFNDDWRRSKQKDGKNELEIDDTWSISGHDEELKSQRGTFGARTRRPAAGDRSSAVPKKSTSSPASAKSNSDTAKWARARYDRKKPDWSHKISLVDD